MRGVVAAFFLAALSFAFVPAAKRAEADVLVRVDRASQTMQVSADGGYLYTWRVSDGQARLQLARWAFSIHSGWLHAGFHASITTRQCRTPIFFYGGFAIHRRLSHIARLGGPASHGCIRLHPNDAAVIV